MLEYGKLGVAALARHGQGSRPGVVVVGQRAQLRLGEIFHHTSFEVKLQPPTQLTIQNNTTDMATEGSCVYPDTLESSRAAYIGD